MPIIMDPEIGFFTSLKDYEDAILHVAFCASDAHKQRIPYANAILSRRFNDFEKRLDAAKTKHGIAPSEASEAPSRRPAPFLLDW